LQKNKLGLSALFISIIFWVVSASPLVLTNDSFLTLDQIFSSKYDDFPTVSYTIYVKLFSANWNFPWLLAILQSIMLVATLFMVLTFIDINQSLTTNSKLLLVSLLEIFPFYGGLGVTLWKDIPFGSFSVIGIILLLKSIGHQQLKFKLLGITFLIVGSSFRHDGWPTLLILLILFLGKTLVSRLINHGTFSMKNEPQIIGMLSISILVTILLGNVLIFLTGATKSDPWWNVASLVGDVAYVSTTQPELLPNKINAQVTSFTSGSSKIGAAQCQSMANMVYSEGFNLSAVNVASNKILNDYPKIIFSKAGLALVKAHLCRTQAFIPWPLSSGPSYVYWVTSGVPMTPYNHHNLQVSYYSNKLSNATNKYITYSNTWAGRLIWPGAILSVTYFMFFFLVLMSRKINQPITFLLAFVTARHVGLIIFGIAQDFRYAFITYLICIPIILFLIIDKWRRIKGIMKT